MDGYPTPCRVRGPMRERSTMRSPRLPKDATFRLSLIAAIIVVAQLGRGTHGAIVTNGGLELVEGQDFASVGAGVTYEGWTTIGPGDVEFIRENVGTRRIGPAFEAEGFVDLNGIGFASGIEQALDTVAGEVYAIAFAISGNPGINSEKLADKTMNILWNDAVVQSVTFTHQLSDTQQELRWEGHLVQVTAQGNDTLTFASTTSAYNDAGPMLDAVVVALVPEPTAVLPGALLVLLRRTWR